MADCANYCVICPAEVLSTERWKSDQGFLQDVVFALKILLEVPNFTKVSEVDSKDGGFCKNCGEGVTKARKIYEQMLELVKEFRKIRRQFVEVVRRRWQDFEEEGDGGELGEIKEDCRKWLKKGGGCIEEEEDERPFVVEDLKVLWEGMETDAKEEEEEPVLFSEEEVEETPLEIEHWWGNKDSEVDFEGDPLSVKEEKFSEDEEKVNEEVKEEMDEENPEFEEESKETKVEVKKEMKRKPSRVRSKKKPPKSWTCQEPNCNLEFSKYPDFKSHVETTHKKAECPLCHSKHVNYAAVRKHIQERHKGESVPVSIPRDEWVCPWEGCGKVIASKYSFQDHLRKHEGNPRHKCEVCKETFYYYSDLVSHRNSNCSKKRRPTPPPSSQSRDPFQCELCGSQLTSKNSLKTHIMTLHNNQYPFNCSQCGSGFVFEQALQVHMARTHKQLEIHQCTVIGCRRAFPKKQQLTAHVARDHGESGTMYRYQCTYCGKGFHEKYKFTQHEMIHTNKETRPFKCEIGGCGKGFANQHNLRYHQLITHKAERKIKRRKEVVPRSYLNKTARANTDKVANGSASGN